MKAMSHSRTFHKKDESNRIFQPNSTNLRTVLPQSKQILTLTLKNALCCHSQSVYSRTEARPVLPQPQHIPTHVSRTVLPQSQQKLTHLKTHCAATVRAYTHALKHAPCYHSHSTYPRTIHAPCSHSHNKYTLKRTVLPQSQHIRRTFHAPCYHSHSTYPRTIHAPCSHSHNKYTLKRTVLPQSQHIRRTFHAPKYHSQSTSCTGLSGTPA